MAASLVIDRRVPMANSNHDSNRINRLLHQASQGDQSSLNQAWPELYKNLHQIAARQMARESNREVLQTTAVVNEAYLRLSNQNRSDWKSKDDFLAAAAVTMRRVLVDAARKRRTLKRSHPANRVEWDEAKIGVWDQQFDILDVNEALEGLASFSPQQSQALELLIFGGLQLGQIAAHLEISVSTVERRIRSARAWLRRELNGIDKQK